MLPSDAREAKGCETISNPVGKAALPAFIATMIRSYYHKDYRAFLGCLTEDCLLLGAGSDTALKARDFMDSLPPRKDLPSRTIYAEHFELVPTDMPDEAMVIGFYSVSLSSKQQSPQRMASDRRRITVNCRMVNGTWKAYLVHSSNEWGLGNTKSLPVETGEQTYRYVQSVLRASRTNSGASDRIAIPSEGTTLFVNPSALIYAQAAGKSTVLHFLDRSFTVKLLLAAIQERLPEDFARIHRSYVVNLNFVTKFNGTTITLSTDERIPVPKRRRHEIESVLRSWARHREARQRPLQSK